MLPLRRNLLYRASSSTTSVVIKIRRCCNSSNADICMNIEKFSSRHIGPNVQNRAKMLQVVGYEVNCLFHSSLSYLSQVVRFDFNRRMHSLIFVPHFHRR